MSFSVESRFLRELGERLVKRPEIALQELIKNSYDADANVCFIDQERPDTIVVRDDGHGMTLEQFRDGWMRIGTGSKVQSAVSPKYRRAITGEKGIGRFAVRFLGRRLRLRSIADDVRHGRTLLTADFDWQDFDLSEDIGRVHVPYSLERQDDAQSTGTELIMTNLSGAVAGLRMYSVRTAAIGVVSPYHSLLKAMPSSADEMIQDRGFSLSIKSLTDSEDEADVARRIVDHFALRAVIELVGERLSLNVYRRGTKAAVKRVVDRISNPVGPLYADIRFFPQRKGTFTGLSVDGRRAKTWVKDHSGVAVFDRAFRVHPYGSAEDDWLNLSADAARRAREPRSSIAKKHFPMDDATRSSTQLNYMLRLPYSRQLVGVVQVEGQRGHDADSVGLISSADREGFVNNASFEFLRDIVRGAVEAIAYEDRLWQQELALAEQKKSP